MEAVIDSGGRILLPKQLRSALGIAAGSRVDISWCGGAIQLLAARAARAAHRELADKGVTVELVSDPEP